MTRKALAAEPATAEDGTCPGCGAAKQRHPDRELCQGCGLLRQCGYPLPLDPIPGQGRR